MHPPGGHDDRRRHRGREDRFGPGPGWGPGRRMRRGDIRVVLLGALLDGPAHGYELIRRLEERSGGTWRPSAGSVYPTLQLLEEEGVVTGTEQDGKRVFTLTEAGRAEAEAAGKRQPFDPVESGSRLDLRRDVQLLSGAVRQVALAGDADQLAAVSAIITDARQRIYRLLAES